MKNIITRIKMAINLVTFIKAAFKNYDNTETYNTAKTYLVNLASKNVPTRILALYTGFIKVYEILKTSCKKLALKVKNSDNELDNYCLKQGLQAVKTITNIILKDVESMANTAGITLD